MALSHGVPLIKRSGQVIYKSAQEENSTREADDRQTVRQTQEAMEKVWRRVGGQGGFESSPPSLPSTVDTAHAEEALPGSNSASDT